MKDIIEGLELIKNRLAQMDRFQEANICKDLIARLKNDDVINVRNNKGQINVGRGNSTIKASQTFVNSPLNVGDCKNQTINYNNWEDD